MALLVLYFAPDTLRVPANFDAVSERLLVRRACCARCFYHHAEYSASEMLTCGQASPGSCCTNLIRFEGSVKKVSSWTGGIVHCKTGAM